MNFQLNDPRTNWKFIAIGGGIVAVIGGVFLFLNSEFMRIDKCLDLGGVWDDEHSRCVSIVEVTLYAYEKDGSHIFDGAVIAAIDASSGKMVAEQLADGDGKVVFSVPEGSYRFQPSPLRENRVVGSLTLFIPLNENKPQTLLLTEVGPSSFGAPVDTCEEKYDAIESIFDTANYCVEDTDCKAILLGGAYADFGCWKYVYKGYQTSILYQRMDEYVNVCTQQIDKCAPSPLVVCRVGRCVQTQQ